MDHKCHRKQKRSSRGIQIAGSSAIDMSETHLRLVWVSPIRREARLKKNIKPTILNPLPGGSKTKVDWGSWIPVFTIGSFFMGIIGLIFVLHSSVSNRLRDIETMLANLNGRLEPIFNQYYQPFEKVADEKGFENAALLPVNLTYRDALIKPSLRSEVKGQTGDVDYDVRFELIELTSGMMTFVLNGRVATHHFTNTTIAVPLKLNAPVEIAGIAVDGGPRFFVEVIGLPSTNIAIVALGPTRSS